MKIFTITATATQNMSATVQAPDDWDEARVMQHYRDNGASGEFTDDSEDLFGGGGWEWGEATEETDMDESDTVDTIS